MRSVAAENQDSRRIAMEPMRGSASMERKPLPVNRMTRKRRTYEEPKLTLEDVRAFCVAARFCNSQR